MDHTHSSAVIRVNDIESLFEDPPVSYDHVDNTAIDKMLRSLKNITEFDKQIIITRYAKLYNGVKRSYRQISQTYNLSKTFIITTGIINPALLSINSNAQSPNYYTFFWIIWILQLVTSLVTSYMSFYKLDKKYFMYNSYKKKLEKEVWNYIELIDKYAIIDENNYFEMNSRETTHQSKGKLFLSKLEKINNQMLKMDFEIESASHETDGRRYKMNPSLLGYSDKETGESPPLKSIDFTNLGIPSTLSSHALAMKPDFNIDVDSDAEDNAGTQGPSPGLQRKRTIRHLQLEKEKTGLIRKLHRCTSEAIGLHAQLTTSPPMDESTGEIPPKKEVLTLLEKKEMEFINLLVGLSKYREADDVNQTLHDICGLLEKHNLWPSHLEKIRQR